MTQWGDLFTARKKAVLAGLDRVGAGTRPGLPAPGQRPVGPPSRRQLRKALLDAMLLAVPRLNKAVASPSS